MPDVSSQKEPGETTAYGRLASFLREQIMAGVLKPSDRLPTEPELSEAYQVSRNTAREALRVLASQGLVTTKRGTSGGTFVAHPTTDQLGDNLGAGLALLAESETLPLAKLVEARELLEVPAAEIAALRRTDDELDELRRCVADSCSLGGDTYLHNRAFHGVLLRATHNPVIELLTEPLYRVLQQRMNRQSQSPEVWAQVNAEHAEILEGIENGDPMAAREATRAHLRSLRQIYDRMDSRS